MSGISQTGYFSPTHFLKMWLSPRPHVCGYSWKRRFFLRFGVATTRRFSKSNALQSEGFRKRRFRVHVWTGENVSKPMTRWLVKVYGIVWEISYYYNNAHALRWPLSYFLLFCDYVWTGKNGSNTLRETSVFTNIRIRVDRA